MPYLPKHQRKILQNLVATMKHPILVDAKRGVMNYLITSLIVHWMGDINYTRINDAIGILECVKLELYRRVAAPYEDTKKEEHGDVYGPEAAH